MDANFFSMVSLQFYKNFTDVVPSPERLAHAVTAHTVTGDTSRELWGDRFNSLPQGEKGERQAGD